MLITGLPVLPVALVTVAGALALLAMQWLKTRYPGHVIASTMLWREARLSSRPRALWQRFARPLSLLLPLLALLFLAAAVLEPVWKDDTAPGNTVVVFTAEGQTAARQAFQNLDVMHRYLVLAQGGGIITDSVTLKPARFLPEPQPVPTDFRAVATLAEQLAGPQGQVIWFGTTPPPQLPPQGTFVPVAATGDNATAPHTLALHLKGGTTQVKTLIQNLPGLRLEDDEKQADLSCDLSKVDADRQLETCYQFLQDSGLYREDDDQLQQQLPPERTATPQQAHSLTLTNTLFALAMLAFLLDLALWNQRRTV